MRGRDSKTYYDSASNWTTPTWVEITKIIDETITPSANLAAGGSRENEYEDNEIASRKFEWNCTYRYKKKSVAEDTVYEAMLTHFNAGTAVFMLFVDGAHNTANRGWKAPILLDQVPQKRDLGAIVEVTLHGVGKLYDDSGTLRAPEAYTGSTTTTTTTTTGA